MIGAAKQEDGRAVWIIEKWIIGLQFIQFEVGDLEALGNEIDVTVPR